LVEILIVVGIIGLLAVLGLPSLLKARKQSQARRILNDARLIDNAIDQGALEMGLKDGDRAFFHNDCNYRLCSCMLSYLKHHAVGSAVSTLPNDVLGNIYIFGTIGTNQVKVNPASKSALHGVGVDWGAY
jgi:type II secretory pathway pseudopilin PulG